jgi:hypothetical protein
MTRCGCVLGGGRKSLKLEDELRIIRELGYEEGGFYVGCG